MGQINRVAEVWKQQLPQGESALADFENLFFPTFLDRARHAERILEIGAGRGRMVRVLRSYGVDAQFVCLDLNNYVREADGLGVLGNAISLPFPDNCFDLVYSLGVVEHFPETASALSEHVRVVKPGGMILVTVPHLSPYTLFRWIVWFVRFRSRGTFEETLGRNIRVKFLVNELRKHRLRGIDAGAGGIFLPSVTKRFRKFMGAVFPERRFGAYCWVIGEK